MAQITRTKNQHRITIPKEILVLTKWDENTVLAFIPKLKEPNSKLDKNTPIFLREVK